MYIEIYHTRSNDIKTVTELDDLSFDDGWRYLGTVSTSKVCPFKVDEEKYELQQRRADGYIDLSNRSLSNPHGV